jgi:predicted esterase
MSLSRWLLLGLFLTGLLLASPLRARDDEDDDAKMPSQDLRAGKDENKRYFLIGPRKDGKTPEKGFGLVVILPGGDGSADFLPFVKSIARHALPEGYLAVQPVALKWTEGQQIVWPTAKSPVADMKFSTEEFVEAVIQDVGAKHKLDPRHIFTLSWSSSGPAAYAISLREKNPVTGSLIAMSVFKPNLLPSLKAAKGHAYYLYHSEEDRVCPFRFAAQARDDMKEHGAKVELRTYEGGHGWHGPVHVELRKGITWLEKNHAQPGKEGGR